MPQVRATPGPGFHEAFGLEHDFTSRPTRHGYSAWSELKRRFARLTLDEVFLEATA
jgi:hypothetical protein